MEPIYAGVLAILEMTFVFAALLLLHDLRKVIGSAAFYVSLGLLFVFTELLGAADMNIVTGFPGFNFNLASTVLMLPFLCALTVIYITDGTIEAQRLIIALIAALGVYTYLSGITITQIDWNADGAQGITFSSQLSALFKGSIHSMSANVVSFSIDLFLLPIMYQRLRNWGCRLFFCVTGALFIGQLVDSLLYSAICYWGESIWWTGITYSCIARAVSILILSCITVVYLSRIDLEEPGTGRGSLDIIIAFFGSYGKAQALEHHLHESEERYRILFSGAADMIAAADLDGVIFDANEAGLRLLGMERTEFGSLTLFEAAGMDRSFLHGLTGEEKEKGKTLACTVTMTRTKREADLAFTRANIADTPILIVFGHDVTEQRRMERERQEWQEQSFHRQRLESIGRLAGGIAHDFNNFLHAMQGHLDIIRYMHPVEDPDVLRHLESLDAITEKAADLTRQLLGFARKGNYNETDVNLPQFLRSTAALFMPGAAPAPVDLKLDIAPDVDFTISGDPIQLQQAVLNILFNARYAMRDIPEQDRRIHIRLDLAERMNFQFDPPGEVQITPGIVYCAIRITDSGPGIPDSVIHRIFEPFFTTKPVGEGTGMGLSMAYGILLTHKGWIQAENAKEGGAVFTLVLPLRAQTEQQTSSAIPADPEQLNGK